MKTKLNLHRVWRITDTLYHGGLLGVFKEEKKTFLKDQGIEDYGELAQKS